MVKILSQSGRSLADMYDVAGSVAGIDQLETRELPIVHEMGATVFSERFRTTIRRMPGAATAQSTDISITLANLPESIARILAVQVLSDDASRIAHAVVSSLDATTGQEIPIWVWDGTFETGRVLDNGTTAVFDILTPSPGHSFIPTFTGGALQGSVRVDRLRLRATTTAFGAGNVFLTGLIFVAFSYEGGVSSFGATVPSW